jgi:hypothetical protein
MHSQSFRFLELSNINLKVAAIPDQYGRGSWIHIIQFLNEAMSMEYEGGVHSKTPKTKTPKSHLLYFNFIHEINFKHNKKYANVFRIKHSTIAYFLELPSAYL